MEKHKHPFARRYHDEAACLARLEQLRWPNGPVCQKCGHIGGTEVPGKPRLRRCTNPECRTFISLTGDTPFAYSKTKLPLMFALLERIVIEGDKLVLLPMTRELKVDWSTLHRLVKRLREGLRDGDPTLLALREDVLALHPEPTP